MLGRVMGRFKKVFTRKEMLEKHFEERCLHLANGVERRGSQTEGTKGTKGKGTETVYMASIIGKGQPLSIHV